MFRRFRWFKVLFLLTLLLGFAPATGNTPRAPAVQAAPEASELAVLEAPFAPHPLAPAAMAATTAYTGDATGDALLDLSFDPGTGADSYVYALALQPDGKILIGGYFTTYNGTERNRIARLNPDGSLDTTFDPGNGANGDVYALALQPDGKILIGGFFTEYDGKARNRIARLNPDGSLDTTFDPDMGANNYVLAFALQPDGKILIGGWFTQYNGTTRNRIARLNSDGVLDTTFDPGNGANNYVHALALQPDGKILIGGYFTNYNDVARNYIARLNDDGSLDNSFNPGSGPDYLVYALALQPDGKIIIGGNFISYDGYPRNRIARLIGSAKTVSPTTNVPYHGVVTYTITARNPLTQTDPLVVLTDTLPVEVDFVQWVEQPTGATITNDVLQWSGIVTANETITFTFQARHVGRYGDVVINTAVWKGAIISEHSASATFAVEPPPLYVYKQTDTPYVTHGESLTYTLQIGNRTALTITDVAITDTLPAVLTATTFSSDSAALTLQPDSHYTWSLAELPPGERVHITVTSIISPDAPLGAFDNTAYIAGLLTETLAYSDTATTDIVSPTYTLSIATTGSGFGVVTPAVGAYYHLSGTVVTLTATPNSGSTFSGWSGAGLSGATKTVTLTMDANKAVTATFVLTATDLDLPSAEPAYITKTLCPGESIATTNNFYFVSEAPSRADVVFMFDTTGSMGGVLSSAKTEAIQIMNDLVALIPGVEFGVVHFEDYPVGSYGSSSDVPYRLVQSVTADQATIESAINSIGLGSGNDGPEAYSRALYESYADPSIGWRASTRRLVVMFGDAMPHDDDPGPLVSAVGWEGTPGMPDLGRDEIEGTPDDLYLQDVLLGMKANGITLLYINSGSWVDTDWWDTWAGLTGAGGGAVELGSGSLAETIVEMVTTASAEIGEVSLQTYPREFYSWLTPDPTSYSDISVPTGGITLTFDILITLPGDVEPGKDYVFSIQAMGDGAPYSEQKVNIHVPSACRGIDKEAEDLNGELLLRGDQVRYTVTVSNSFPYSLTNVIVTDTLPAGVTLDTVTPTLAGNDPLHWTVGALLPDTRWQAVLTVTLGDTAITANNYAEFSSDQLPLSQVGPVGGDVQPWLEMTKTAVDLNGGHLYRGDIVRYEVSLVNTSGITATNVVVTDTLPTTMTLVSASPTPLGSAPALHWELGRVPPTMTWQAIITMQVPITATAVGGNLAQSSCAEDASWEIGPIYPPDGPEVQPSLAITKTGTLDSLPLRLGDPVRYTVIVTNNASLTTTQVVVTDAVPAGLTYISATIEPESTDPLVWTVGDMAPDDSWQVEITTHADGSVSPIEGNYAWASGENAEEQMAGPIYPPAVRVMPSFVLAKDAVDVNSAPLYVGDMIRYTLYVTNIAASTITDLVVTDTLPTGVTFVTATQAPDSTSPQVVWRLANLEGGAGWSAELTARVDGSANPIGGNYAKAVSTEAGERTVGPIYLPEGPMVEKTLNIGKTAEEYRSAPPLLVGDQILYTIRVTNATASAISNLIVTDTLPAGVTYFRTPKGSPRPNQTGNPIVWERASLDANATQTFRIIVKATGDTSPLTDNVATATCSEDTTPQTATANLDNATVQKALTLLKDAVDLNGAPLLINDIIRYPITVTNTHATVTMTHVVVTDTLPAGTVMVSATQNYTETAGTLWWQAGDLEPGDTWAVVLYQRVDGTVNPIAVNVAAVRSDQQDWQETGEVTPPDPVVPTFTLTTAITGTGNGTISPTVGSHSYLAGTVVTLTATSDSDSTFDGWSGAGLSGATETVTLTMDANKAVTATFDLITHTLTIAKTGAGDGIVTPTVGTHSYVSGTTVALEATPDTGSLFGGWSGALNEMQTPVTLTMDTDKIVTATFTLSAAPSKLAISKTAEEYRSAPPLLVGDQILYTIRVTNASTGTLTNLVVTDTLPAGVTYFRTPKGSPRPDQTGNPVVWEQDSLDVDTTQTFRVIVKVDGTTNPIKENQVAAACDQVETPATATAPAPSNGAAEPGLVITGTLNSGRGNLPRRQTRASASALAVGDRLTYTLTVTNSNDSLTLHNLVVTATLPSGAELVNATPTGSLILPHVRWQQAELGPGVSWHAQVVVRQTAAILGEMALTAATDEQSPLEITITPPGGGQQYVYLPLVVRH